MNSYGDSLKVLVLTGGECMIYLNNVERNVKYSTNLGLSPVINIETYDNAKFKSTNDAIKRDGDFLKCVIEGKIKVENGVWMPIEKKDTKITYNELGTTPQYERCSNLFNNIPINPYGEVMACCGLICEYVPYLRLGNINRATLKNLYESSFNDILKIWLYVDGPCRILNYIKSRKQESQELSVGHICDSCRQLFGNRENIEFLRSELQLETASAVAFAVAAVVGIAALVWAVVVEHFGVGNAIATLTAVAWIVAITGSGGSAEKQQFRNSEELLKSNTINVWSVKTKDLTSTYMLLDEYRDNMIKDFLDYLKLNNPQDYSKCNENILKELILVNLRTNEIE